MHDELEEALRELEAKLPDLRHLIIESGGVLASSRQTQAIAARLLRSVAVADELASQLRLLFLGGGELPVPASPPIANPLPAAAPPSEPPTGEPQIPAAEPALPEATAEQTFATAEPLSESDAALLEALGLAPETHTIFGETEAKSHSTDDETWIERRMENLQEQIEEALTAGDRDLAVQLLTHKIKLYYRHPDISRREKALQEIEDVYVQMTPEEQRKAAEELSNLERRLGIVRADMIPDRVLPFADFWKEYQPVLQDAVYFYLENASETATVVSGTEEQAERVWKASEGEASQLEIIASIGASQCELLLPREAHEPARHLPTTRQIFAHLETYRFERSVRELEDEIARLEANAQEEGVDVSAELAERRLRLERLISSFYNRRLHLDDDEEDFSGGAIGSKIDPPDPVRDPGSGRTFDEALAAARNP